MKIDIFDTPNFYQSFSLLGELLIITWPISTASHISQPKSNE